MLKRPAPQNPNDHCNNKINKTSSCRRFHRRFALFFGVVFPNFPVKAAQRANGDEIHHPSELDKSHGVNSECQKRPAALAMWNCRIHGMN